MGFMKLSFIYKTRLFGWPHEHQDKGFVDVALTNGWQGWQDFIHNDEMRIFRWYSFLVAAFKGPILTQACRLYPLSKSGLSVSVVNISRCCILWDTCQA